MNTQIRKTAYALALFTGTVLFSQKLNLPLWVGAAGIITA
jgi:hypothetical protein